MPKLISHGLKVFGEKAPEVALAEFLGWPEEDMVPDEAFFDRLEMLFWPWFVFNWEYDRLDDGDHLLDGPEETTIAELYRQSGHIDPSSPEGQLLHAANRHPYSFLEIVAANAGQSVHLKDVLTGEETTVQEKLGSEEMQPGDILFGRAIRAGGIGMFLGMSAYLLPPRIKPHLLSLRRSLAQGGKWLSKDDLYDWDVDLREFFISIDRSLHTLPELHNTDGDPMEFHKLIYDIDSPEIAVEKLATLSVNQTDDDIQAAAERDEEGKILRASFDWGRLGNPINKGMIDTVLGSIEINAGRMIVTVNSAQRAETIRMEIEQRLGPTAKLRLDEISDADSMMARGGAGMPHMENNLHDHPDARQHLKHMLEAHWEAWVDMEIPVLDHKSPRQAVRNADGREAVEALLLDAEKMAQQDPARSDVERELIADVRRKLKLDRPLRKRCGTPSPEQRVQRVTQIKQVLSEFGARRLHDTYTEFALRLCDTIADADDLHIHRGRVEIWAAGIMYAIAQLNFLFSHETPHHLTPEELCNWFSVKQSTVSNKASKIRTALGLFHDDKRFCAPHITQIFEFLENEEGFLLPAAAFEEEEAYPYEPLPLKPSVETKAERLDSTEKPAKQEKNKGPHQLSLFQD